MIYPIFLSISYVLFTVIFCEMGGENELGHPFVNRVFDWRKPVLPAVMSVLTLLMALPFVQCILYGLFQVKEWLRGRYG